jgi:hypothetical protein
MADGITTGTVNLISGQIGYHYRDTYISTTGGYALSGEGGGHG